MILHIFTEYRCLISLIWGDPKGLHIFQQGVGKSGVELKKGDVQNEELRSKVKG